MEVVVEPTTTPTPAKPVPPKWPLGLTFCHLRGSILRRTRTVSEQVAVTAAYHITRTSEGRRMTLAYSFCSPEDMRPRGTQPAIEAAMGVAPAAAIEATDGCSKTTGRELAYQRFLSDPVTLSLRRGTHPVEALSAYLEAAIEGGISMIPGLPNSWLTWFSYN